MVLEKVSLEGYEALKKALEGSKVRTIVLFTGSKAASGKSWCPDCVAAEPVIEKVVQALSSSTFAGQNNVRYIECSVGAREYWKDQKNPFRTDLKVSCVPTLIEHGVKGKKLVENQLTNEALVQGFFEDED